MLSSDDNQGIIYFLVGMVVIVLTAVGLSILVDKRISFSSGRGVNQRELAATTAELEELKSLLEVRKVTLEQQEKKGQSLTSSYQNILDRKSSSSALKSDLLAKKKKLTEELAALDSSFSEYRSDYRNRTWTKAVGESHPQLAIRGGRVYRDITITKVTEVGLEIRHTDGNARIQAPELDALWQDRFQWNDEERRNRLKDEEAKLQAMSPPKENVPTREDPFFTEVIPSPVDPAEADKISNVTALRSQVIKWRSQVSLLASERSIAASNASRSNQNSVPGRLETWEAKLSRLSSSLVRAQGELAKAKAELAAVSPSDPLLQVNFDSRN